MIAGRITDLNSGKTLGPEEISTEVKRRAGTIATALKPDRRFVLIAQDQAMDAILDLLAVWCAGGTAVMLNPGLTESELENVAGWTDAALCLAGARDVTLNTLPVWQTSYPTESCAKPLGHSLDDPALVLFTSGTSGTPKGVVLSHRSLQARLDLNVLQIGRDALANALNLLPLHFGHGLIGNCLTPLYAGGSLCLMPGAGLAAASGLSEIIDRHNISFMSSVPGFWKLALRLSEPPKSRSLKRIHIGSAPLAADLWRDISDWGGVPVWNMYGLTENANWAAGTDQIEDCAIGRLWGGQARLRTEAGEWVEHGEGELFLRSASLMSGYLNQPDLTAEVMQDGWYQTGDVVQLSATGQLHLVGRNRYAINMDGTKIYPEELDLLFERHSALTDVCTFAMPDPAGGEQVGLAFVALDEVTDVDLRTWASERLRPEAIPTVWQQMEALPRSDRGKLNRDLVRDAVLKAKAK